MIIIITIARHDMNIDNSTIYIINIKINNISNGLLMKAFAIQYVLHQKSMIIFIEKKWCHGSNNYIANNICAREDDEQLSNRLYCGYGDDGRENYASSTNNFIYQNTNNNYKLIMMI